eukprot:1904808-Amphidinium_carterae.1
MSTLEASLRDSLTTGQEAQVVAQAEVQRRRALELHAESHYHKEVETFESRQRKNAEWYDRALEVQKRNATERISAIALQERTAREQMCKDLETKAELHRRASSEESRASHDITSTNHQRRHIADSHIGKNTVQEVEIHEISTPREPVPVMAATRTNLKVVIEEAEKQWWRWSWRR